MGNCFDCDGYATALNESIVRAKDLRLKGDTSVAIPSSIAEMKAWGSYGSGGDCTGCAHFEDDKDKKLDKK